MSEERSPYYDTRDSSLVTRLSLHVREQVYRLFMREFGDAERIVDVGVTSERESPDANFLERLHPHKDRITAVGIEDAGALEMDFPGVKFHKVAPGARLPFEDDAFDVAFSHAVVEHVVGADERAFFFSELVRVARAVFVTTPNRFFPVEHHTKLPFLHIVAPRAFYFVLDSGLKKSFFNSSNLRPLSERELLGLCRPHPSLRARVERIRLAGMASNLVLVAKKRAPS